MADDFNPDAYLASKNAGNAAAVPAPASIPVDPTQVNQFDPDDYLNQKSNDNFNALQTKYGGAGQQTIAGLEALASGATLGGSRLLENATGLSTPEAQAGRMQANPVTSGLSNLVGGGALIGATGGLAAPLEGAGLGAEALGNVGVHALQFGAEGAGFGAGQAVSDYAIGDPKLNAQKVLADIGSGALFGGLLGAGTGAIGEALEGGIGSKIEDVSRETNSNAETAGALFKKIPGSDLLTNPQKELAPEIIAAGERQGLPVSGAMTSASPWQQKFYSALVDGAPTIPAIQERAALDQGFQTVDSKLSDIFDTGAPGQAPLTKRQLGQILQDSFTQKIADANAPISNIFERIKAQGVTIPVADDAASSAVKDIMNLPGAKNGFADGQLATRVAKRIPMMETAEDVRDYVSSLNKSISPTASPGEKHMAGAISDVLNDLFENSVEQSAHDPQLQGTPEMQQEMLGLLDEHKQAKALYKPFIRDVNTFTEQLGKKNTGGPQAAINFINGLDPEVLPDELLDKKYADFNNFMEDRFPEQAAQLRQYAKAKLKEGASKSGIFSPKILVNNVRKLEPEIQSQIFNPKELETIHDLDTWLTNVPKNYNPSNTSNMGALRAFMESPTGATIANARDFGIKAYMMAMDKLASRPQPFQAGAEMAEKVNAMSAVQKIAQGIDDDISTKAKAIFRNVGEGVALTGGAQASDKGYDKLSKSITHLSANPGQVPDMMSTSLGNLPAHIPNISQEMTNASIAGLSFLANKLPKPMGQMPLAPKYEPSLADKQKFMRYATAVQNPVSALSQVKNGTISQETMEALNAVHLQLLNQMQGQVKTELAKKDVDKIPYRVKLSLGKFLGQPLDSSQLPQTIMANQASLSGPQLGQQQAAPTGRRGGAHALSKLNLAANAATPLRDRQSDEE